MRWLFPGKEVRIDTRCLDCGETLSIRLRDDQILDAEPSTIAGLMSIPIPRWSEVSFAFN